VSALQDALVWYTYDVANIISSTSIAKKIDCGDRGGFNMFQELMHSWVGYKLVKVLLTFGLGEKNLGRPGKLVTGFIQSFFLPWRQTMRPFKKRTC
jgi:hypothetical protein